MPPNLYSQNSSPYAPGGPEKTKPVKLLLLVLGALAIIIIIVFIVHVSRSDSQQSKYIKSVTAAARKQIPDAKVTDVKVAGDFAVAHVSNPKAEGQAAAGNQTYFKLNKDGSSTQIASGSSFSPVDLSGLGMSLATQAKLTGRSLTESEQYLAATCDYIGGNEPGYVGFNGSFDPGGWQIDAGTLNDIEQSLTTALSAKNAQAKSDEKIICINATRKASNATTDKQTLVSTFTLQLQFITGRGAVTTHSYTFAVGPNNYQSYTLDGQKI